MLLVILTSLKFLKTELPRYPHIIINNIIRGSQKLEFIWSIYLVVPPMNKHRIIKYDVFNESVE